MALYSYFADKQALLTALALEGFEKVAKRFDPPFTVIRLPRSGKYCWITLLMPRRTPTSTGFCSYRSKLSEN